MGQLSGLFEHNTDEGDDVQIGKGLSQALVVTDETPEAGGPGEGALGDPTPGQQHEATLRLGQFDRLQFDPLRPGRRGRLVARVPLVDEGDLDALPRGRLHGLGEPADLGAVVRPRAHTLRGFFMAARIA